MAGTQITIQVPYQVKINAPNNTNLPSCYQEFTVPPFNTNFANVTCLYQLLLPNQWITTTIPSEVDNIIQFTLWFGTLLNPSSCITNAYFQVTFANGDLDGTSQVYLNQYTPGPLPNAAVSLLGNPTTAGAKDQYQFIFQITNTIPQGGSLQLTFPSSSYTTAQANVGVVTISVYGTVKASTQTYSGETVTFSGVFNNAALVPSSQYISITITQVTNPNTIGTTASFIISTLDVSGNTIDQVSTGLGVTIAQPGYLSVTQFTPSTIVVEATAYLTIDITPTVTYSPGGYIEVVGPTPFVVTTLAGTLCQATFGFKTSAVCTTSLNTYTVDFSAIIDTSQTSQLFYILSFINPRGVMTLPSYKIYYKNPDTTVVAQVTTGLTYTTTGGKCYLTSATRSNQFTVGLTGAILDIAFHCDHKISIGGYVIILIPQEQMAFSTGMTCTSTSNTAVNISTGGCQATSILGGTYTNLTVLQWCTNSATTDCPVNTTLTIQINNALNPGYIVPTALLPSIQISTMNPFTVGGVTTYYLVDSKTTGIVLTGSLIPGVIANLVVTKTGSTLTGGIPTYTFAFTTATKILSAGYISIDIAPKTIYISSSLTLSCGANTCSKTANPADLNQLLYINYTSLCPASCALHTAFTLTATNIINPFSVMPNTNKTYYVATYTTQGYLIDYGTTATGPTLTLQTNVLTATQTQPALPGIVVGQLDTYVFTITNPHNYIPAIGGSLYIDFPPTVVIQSQTCSATGNGITLTCTVPNITTVIVTTPSDLPIGSTISVQMGPNNVQNPQTGAPSGTFQIGTLYLGTYGMDTYNALFIKCDTSNAITNAISTRTVIQAGFATGLTICFQTTNPIPSNAIFLITIPKNQVTLTSPVTATGTSGGANSGTISQNSTDAAVTGTTQTVAFYEWCSGSTCTSSSTQCVTWTSTVTNPSTNAVSSTSIIIQMTTFDGYIIDLVNIGVITTPYVSLGPLNLLNMVRTNDIVGQEPTYTITFQTNTGLGLGDLTLNGGSSSAQALIVFPLDFVYQVGGGQTCQVKNPGGTFVSTTCQFTSSLADPNLMGNYISQLTVNLKCASLVCGDGATLILSITGSGFDNGYNTKSLYGSVFTLATEYTSSPPSSALYVVNSKDMQLEATSSTTSIAINNFVTDTIYVSSISRSTTTVDQPVTVTFTLTTPTRLQVGGFITVNLPNTQFVATGQAFLYQYVQVPGSSFSGNTSPYSFSTTSTPGYITLQLAEFCAYGSNHYCLDGSSVKFSIVQGIKNARSVAPPTNFITILTQTPDQLGNVDYLAPSLQTIASGNLTAATITLTSFALSSVYVGAMGVNLDISMKLGASMTSTDSIILTFSQEFVRNDVGTQAAFNTTSGSVQLGYTSTPSSGNGIISSITITNFCQATSCSGTNTVSLRITNLVNLLQQVPFTGTVFIQVVTSAGYAVSQVTKQLSTITTLLPGILTPATVTRSSPYQGDVATYTFTFTTPGVLLVNALVKLSLPFQQILFNTGVTAFSGVHGSTTIGLGAVTSNANYIYQSFTYNWPTGCSLYDCTSLQTISFKITNSLNPFITTTTNPTPFIIQMYSTTGNIIFQSGSIIATPALIYGLMTNVSITQQISSYVNDITGYTFYFTTTGAIPQNGEIRLTFPPNRVYKYINTGMTCSVNGVSYSSGSGLSTSWVNPTTVPVLTITIAPICTSGSCPPQSYVVICTGNMKNPPSVASITQNFTIDSTDSHPYIIDEAGVLNGWVTTILPYPIIATVVRQSDLLSISTTYTVSFTTENIIPAGGFVRIIIPLDQVIISTAGPGCFDATANTLLVCNIIYSDGITTMWIDILSKFCGANQPCPAGQPIQIMLENVDNPSFLIANDVTSTWQIYTMNANKEYIDGDYTNLMATPPLVGKTVNVLGVQLDNNVVNSNTFIKIKFRTNSYFDSTGIFDIFFPDLLFLSLNVTQCQALQYETIGFYCSFTLWPSGFIQKVSLLNPCPFDCDSTDSYVYAIPVLTRGDLYPVAGTFEVNTRYSYMDVGQGNITNTLSLIAGSITQYYISNKGCNTVDQICSIFLSFTQLNPIPLKENLGRIFIQSPSQLVGKSTNCQLTIAGNTYSSTCNFGLNSQTIVATHDYPLKMMNQNLTIELYQVKNPGSTAPTDSFIIRTQAGYADSSGVITYYDIDNNLTGIFYQITTPTPFKQVNVYRNAMNNNNGYLTGNPTQLVFELTLDHALAPTAQFQFKFPAAAQVMFSPLITGYQCYSVDSSYIAQSVLLCTYQPSNQTIIVQNLCYVTDCTLNNVVRFKVYDDFIQNYNAVVWPLSVVNDSLSVWSTTNDGFYFIDGTTTGIVVTPNLQPNQLILQSPEIIRTANVVYQDCNWVLNFKVNVNPVPYNGYITIQVPQGVLFPRSSSPITLYDYDTMIQYTNVTYTTWPDTQKTINLIIIYNFCNNTNGTGWILNCSVGSSYSIFFDNIQNPPSQINVKLPVVIQTFTSQGYIIETGQTPTINQLFSQLIPLKISKIQIAPVNPIPNVVTDYQIYISNNGLFFASTDSALITFPPEVSLLNYTPTSRRMLAASQLTNRCSNIFEPYLQITCTMVGTNQLKVDGLFASSIQYFGLYVKQIKNPSTNMTTSPLQLVVVNSAGLSIASRTTQTTILIYPILQANAKCSQVCKTCAGSNSTCTSCNDPAPYPFLKDYSCIDECGDGYFVDEPNLKCYPCQDSCLTCFGPGNNKCYNCAPGFTFQNGVCLVSCDIGYQQNIATQQCVSPPSTCNSSCKTCSSNPNYCLSCNTNNSLHSVLDPWNGKCIPNNQSYCNNSISSRFFINETTMQCEVCSELCKTCTGSADVCTSCQTFFTQTILSDLYLTCVDSCGLGTFYNKTTNICSWCNPICMLCEGHGPDQCLVCNKTPEAKQLYFFENQCMIQCPVDYSPDIQTYTCTKEEINYFSFVYLFVASGTAFIVLMLLLSTIFSCFRNRFFDIMYAWISFVEIINRAALLGNLWVKSSVFTLAVCFMNMIATSAIGVFFNFLFMSPIYAHSPHFRTLQKQHVCAYQFITFLSYIGGVNLMRLLTSKFMGCKAFKSDLNTYKFYFQPLNTMSNFTLIFTLAQGAICAYCLFTFTIYDDVYILSAFGAILNVLCLLMQIVKHFLIKIQLSRYDKNLKSQKQQRRQ